MQAQRRRRKPGCQVACDPAPDTAECELFVRNAEASPLLRLPPEIRNRIFALVLTVGQIHVRYRPWRHRTRFHKGAGYTDTIPGGFYGVAVAAGEDPWRDMRGGGSSSTAQQSGSAPSKGGRRLLADALTLLAPVCRQLYRETATLPFCLNAWSFENAHIMERYLLRDRRLTLPQRRALAVLVVSDDLPTRAVEKHLGGLRVVVWKDGKTFHRWELASAAELRRLVERTKAASAMSSGRGICGGWHLYG